MLSLHLNSAQRGVNVWTAEPPLPRCGGGTGRATTSATRAAFTTRWTARTDPSSSRSADWWVDQHSFSSLHTWERGLNRSTEQKAWAQFQESYIFPIIFLELFVALTPWWSPTLPVTILLLLPLFPLSLLLLVLILSLIPMPMPGQLSPLHTEWNLLLHYIAWAHLFRSSSLIQLFFFWLCLESHMPLVLFRVAGLWFWFHFRIAASRII